MESVWQLELVQLELVTAGFVIALSTVVGWLLQRTAGGKGIGGAILLGLAAIMASLICISGSIVGYTEAETKGAQIGLLAGMVLAGVLIPWLFGRFVRGQSGRFMAGLWFAFCALCLVGYLAGGGAGLLTAALPCMVMFWVVLSRISRLTLPLRGEGERAQAFRCLLTYAMGTNYPYYVVRAGEVEERVRGNPFLQFFAGPGIVYADPDQGAYVTNNQRITQILGPGLNFTRVYEANPRALDLRPQVRTFSVRALTRDGIPIWTEVSTAFKLRTGTQGVQPGDSFPLRHRTAYQVATAEYVERRRQPTEQAEKHQWDRHLISLLVTPILLDIISRYDVDELCEPLQLNRDPRSDIVTELRFRTRRALSAQGVVLLDCWFNNLTPGLSVVQRRTANWRTEWEQRILMLMSQGRAGRARQLEQARAQAELDILLRFSQIAKRSRYDAHLSQTALALRFVDCLGEIISESKKQWPLPDSYEETLRTLRGELEDGQR